MSISRLIFTTCLLVALATLFTTTFVAFDAFRYAYGRQVTDGLNGYARLIVQATRPYLHKGDREALTRYFKVLTDGMNARVTLMLSDGTVVGDTREEVALLDNHGDREEVREAIRTGVGQSRRYSDTLGQHMLYHAVSIEDNDVLLGVVRVSLPQDRMLAILHWVRLRILLGVAAVVVFALLVSILVSRGISRPVKRIITGVQHFAQGDFTAPLQASFLSEVAVLSKSLNEMAAQLDERLRSITKERNQQEAVLSSMVEGVLAVDNQGRIMTVNQAASRLTGINFVQDQQTPLRDVAPNAPLSQFVIQILNSAKPKESEFGNLSQSGRILQVHGSVLRDAQGKGIGAVVVLNDVTRLRRLEQVRRDFVANVSHELRTPITSIKGFVETLLDGALDNPEDARRFLEIVAKQSDRLNAILGDLLMLSRVEEGEEKVSIKLETLCIRDTLEAALQLCAKKAAAKCIAVSLDCPAGIKGHINSSLLEQAVANLIDNAIKYSPAGSEVAIRAEQQEEVVICVEDHGCGVAAEHLPRLFERFYRVDKARSRALGGTGLGLSIVNHVVTAHGGRVTVESVPELGSTFSIYLPPI